MAGEAIADWRCCGTSPACSGGGVGSDGVAGAVQCGQCRPTRPDLQDSTRQHAVDDPRLSCNLLQGAPYYAEAFSPLPGRCFRLIARPGEAGPTHCSELVAWRGSWQAPSI